MSHGVTGISPETVLRVRPPTTIQQAVHISGIGLHTGHEVEMQFLPADAGTGIQFRRIDLPGSPLIPARVTSVSETRRCTTIGRKGAYVHTVEHVLSALSALRIDNLVIELSEAEPPAAGGCALPFVELVQAAGIEELPGEIPVITLNEPVYYSHGDVHLVGLPSEEYRVSYTLDYPQVPALQSQYCSAVIEPEVYVQQLANCRTFALYEELTALMDAGLIKGGTLDSAVVVRGKDVLCKGGLRFPNEMARHKVLDLVGDLALAKNGIELMIHVIAIRSGHAANVAFAGRLYESLQNRRAA
jgi:UDP-3-O-[3-hydroxymyristoyl] N-acetylglucosamine deacetylase